MESTKDLKEVTVEFSMTEATRQGLFRALNQCGVLYEGDVVRAFLIDYTTNKLKVKVLRKASDGEEKEVDQKAGQGAQEASGKTEG